MKESARTKCLRAFQRLRVYQESCGGYAKCISCGRVLPVSQMDGGHYIGRRHTGTELEPDNVQPQCRQCNRFLSGDTIAYRAGLIKKIGEKRVERLESMIGEARKRSSKEYDELAKEFRKELRELQKNS
jgi:5-methylcytosine-specific restriction endonuclease McrA